MELVTLRCYP